MAENTDEEHIDKQSTIQSENSTEEITSTKESEAINTNQEIENMEVHHHAHHAGKKNWKSYFWEFLMLFLAVFCGFLAEYKLEHVIEHQRERKYMQLMIEDLKQDTSEINSCIKRIDEVLIPAHKRSTALLFKEKYEDSTMKEMYADIPKSLQLLPLNFQDVTSTQLKNSGNFRLIENTEVSTRFIIYWNSCNFMETTLLSGYNKTRNDSKDMFFSIFNLSNYEDNSPFSPIRQNASCKLISDNKRELIQLGNNISNLQSQLGGPFKQNLSDIYEQASKLIELIRTEYHIK